MIDDNMLIEALILYEKKWLASLPPAEELARMYMFSPGFERRMERLFSQQRKTYYPYINRAWKRAVLAAVIALLLFGATMSVSALREPVIRFVIEVYEKFSSLFYNEVQAINEIVYYNLTYLPEGYTLISVESTDAVIIHRYENADGERIYLKQFPMQSYEMQLNTEGKTIDDVEVNGNHGVFYQNIIMSNVAWSDGTSAFLLSANLDKNEVVSLANSVDVSE